MTSALSLIDKLNDRVRTVERQAQPTISTTQASDLVDNTVGKGVDYETIQSTTDPSSTFTNPIAQTGTEWLNPTTETFKWWNSEAWVTGEFPYANNGDITMFVGYVRNHGQTQFKVNEAVSAPSSPVVGALWTNASTLKRWNGSSWVTITDSLAKQVVADAQDAYGINNFIVFILSTAPTAVENGDLWINSTDWSIYVWSQSSWNYIPQPGDYTDIVITASKFQTSEYGQRMVLEDDTAGGVIKFWTGLPDETAPGFINPVALGSDLGAGIDLRTPNLTGKPRARLILQGEMSGSGGLAAEAQVHVVDGALIVDGTSKLHSTIISSGGLTILGGGLDVIGSTLFESAVHIDSSPLTVSGADVNIEGADHTVSMLNPPSVAGGSANVNWNSATGNVRNITSLSKYKVEKEVLTLAEAQKILKPTPKTFYDRYEYERNGKSTDGLRRYAGLIAEEVDKYAPLFALYSDDGELEGVAYDRVPAALIVIVKDHEERIAALEARM